MNGRTDKRMKGWSDGRASSPCKSHCADFSGSSTCRRPSVPKLCPKVVRRGNDALTRATNDKGCPRLAGRKARQRDILEMQGVLVALPAEMSQIGTRPQPHSHPLKRGGPVHLVPSIHPCEIRRLAACPFSFKFASAPKGPRASPKRIFAFPLKSMASCWPGCLTCLRLGSGPAQPATRLLARPVSPETGVAQPATRPSTAPSHLATPAQPSVPRSGLRPTRVSKISSYGSY